MVLCNYCNGDFKNNAVLKAHQKTAKYCLLLRDELTGDFSCQYCARIFTTKRSNILHEKICKSKSNNKSSEEYEKEIEQLKLEKTVLHTQLAQITEHLYHSQQQVEKLQLSITELAKQGMAKSSVTKNIKNTKNIQVNMTPMVMDQKKIKEKIDSNLTIEDVFDAPAGIADFLYKFLLTDENGKKTYVCSDPARKNFFYFDEYGNKQTDIKGLKFWSLVKDPLFQFSDRLLQDQLDEQESSSNGIGVHCVMKKAEKMDDLKKDSAPIISILAAKSYTTTNIPPITNAA